MLQPAAQVDRATFEKRLRNIGEGPRYWEINRLEALWCGIDIDGRPSFWDDSVPMRDRAPMLRGHCAQIAASRLVPLVFGESRFPALTVGNAGSDLAGIALDETSASALTSAAEFCVKQAKLRLVMRQALEHGLKCRTAVAVCSLRGGKLRVDLLPAKECTPTFDAIEDDRVTALDRRYRYPHPSKPNTFLWYRRLITETEDRTWRDVPVDDRNGEEPAWDAFPSKAFAIPFCPVVWIRNVPEPGAVGDIDGVALFDGKEAEVAAIDRSVSMRHRNALFNGDPQTFLLGADFSDISADTGPKAGLQNDAPAKGFWANVIRSGAGSAIKKSPGRIVALKKDGADVKQIESTGTGAEILSKDIEGNKRTLFDAVGVVVVNPADIAGDASGETLKKLTAPMLAVCDNLRECWGDALVRIVGTLLRLIASPQARTADGLVSRVHSLPNAAVLLPLLQRFSVSMETGASDPATGVVITTSAWFDPPFDLEWGPYYPPTASEKQAAIAAAVQALGGYKAVLTLRTVLNDLASMFGIRDVDAEIKELHGGHAEDTAAVGSMIDRLAKPASDPSRDNAEPPTQRTPDAPEA